MKNHTYIAIDLKSFYASAECADRKLDPLTTHLVVADESRTEKTICLAVSPALKACGIPGRPRLFEVAEKVRIVNGERLNRTPGHRFEGRSSDAAELARDPTLELAYVVARPRMARYLEISAQIYQNYLRYVAAEDVHVYSIDEVFIDATSYLKLYRLTAREFAMKLIREVLQSTGITATAGIGPNLYLCKIAMDVMAKHIPADENGVRIAELDEMSYRRELWDHRPITDFWRIGCGYADKLASHGLHTMGDVARMSLQKEELFYRLFGVNAELLIDHAWGWEPCTIKEIKNYRPASSSLSSGQVLQEPYPSDKARLVTLEMADQLSLDLAEKRLICRQIVLDVGYDVENLADPGRQEAYSGAVHVDHYGRRVPQGAHGSANLPELTASTQLIMAAAGTLFDRIADPKLLIRRLNVTAAGVVPECSVTPEDAAEGDLFADPEAERKKALDRQKEKALQQAIVKIRQQLGKNALLKGMSLMEGATAKMRNDQIGGHRK